MVVACLRIQFLLPDCQSLKQKRFVLNSLKTKLRNRFNVALCETDFQDKWQRSEFGLVTVASARRGVDKSIQDILSFLENDRRIAILECEKEFY